MAQIALAKLLALAKASAQKAVARGPGGKSDAAGNPFTIEQLGVDLEDITNDAILRLAERGILAFSVAYPDSVEVTLNKGLRGLKPYLVTTMQHLLTDKAKKSREYKRSLDAPMKSAKASTDGGSDESTLKETLIDKRATRGAMARLQVRDLEKAIERLTPMEKFYFLMSHLPEFWETSGLRELAIETAAQVLRLRSEDAGDYLQQALSESRQLRGSVLSTKEIQRLIAEAGMDRSQSIQAIDTGYSRARAQVGAHLGVPK